MPASLPRRCAKCGSREGQFTVDEFHCFVCDTLTDSNGVAVPRKVQYGEDWVDPNEATE